MDSAAEQALINEILDSPELDEPVMVYADWLEERGDQRAKFLRTQSEFNKFDFEHPAVSELRSELLEQWNSLAKEHSDWLSSVATRYNVWYLSGNFGKIQFVAAIRALTGFSLADAMQQADRGSPSRVLTDLEFPKAEAACQMALKAKWFLSGNSKLIAILPNWRDPPQLNGNSTNKNDSTVPKS